MQKLIISLITQDHPFHQETNASYEAWGKITILILNEIQELTLKVIEWDILRLVEWFVAHMQYIANEDFNVLGESLRSDESISEAMYRIRIQKFHISETDESTNDEDKLLEEAMKTYDSYYDRHSLRANLLGSKMPEILIGLRKFGVGEISLFSEDENWRYEYKMDVFIDEFKTEIKNFIHDWLAETTDPKAHQRGLDILNSVSG